MVWDGRESIFFKSNDTFLALIGSFAFHSNAYLFKSAEQVKLSKINFFKQGITKHISAHWRTLLKI
jgi:hypothetical protein